MRLFSRRPLSMGVAASAFAKPAPFLRAFSSVPRFAYSNAEPPKWETGEVKVLKPKYRMHARKLRLVIKEAESLGYLVLRRRPPVEMLRYPPKMKSEKKEVKRLEAREAKISKALVGMDKRRDAMHKKDRDERYAAKMKGIARYFPERRHAPKKKGVTHYKRRRAIGKG